MKYFILLLFIYCAGGTAYAQRQPVTRDPVYRAPYKPTRKVQFRRAETVSPVRHPPLTRGRTAPLWKTWHRDTNYGLDYRDYDRYTHREGAYGRGWEGSTQSIQDPYR